MDHQHYNPDRFTRKSLRLSHRDYSAAGAYFVTIRALPPDPLFDKPRLRFLLLDVWRDLPKRFAHVTLDEFVIMPDHVHFMLWLDGTRGKNLTLGSVVGVYKSLTTVLWLQHLKSVGKDMRYACHIWQDGYYERVVRVDELEQTRQYIRANPTKGRQETAGESL